MAAGASSELIRTQRQPQATQHLGLILMIFILFPDEQEPSLMHIKADIPIQKKINLKMDIFLTHVCYELNIPNEKERWA